MQQRSTQDPFVVALHHHHAGRLREAEQMYRQILAQQPGHAEAMHHLGVIAHSVGRHDVAVDLIRRAIALNDKLPQAYSNLGVALKDWGKLDEAIEAYRQAIAHHPTFAEALSNLGNALTEKGQLDEALAVLQQAVAARPKYPEAHYNLGIVLMELKRPDEAIAAYRKAVDLKPNHAKALCNLGQALADRGEIDESIAVYRQSVASDPSAADIHSNLIYTMHYHLDYDSRAIARELGRWTRQHIEPLRKSGQFNPAQVYPNDRSPDRRLRIGLVSPDFRKHVVGYCLLPLLRHIDHQQFEITCYASVSRPDETTGWLRKHADRWRSIVTLSEDQAAELIRQDEIDILIDLALHTAHNRLLVFARKPAPIQATYLGLCGTTGLTAIDWRISDPHMDPPGADQSWYSEKTVILPRTYWCYEPGGEGPAPGPLSPDGATTFGCLNNFSKVSKESINLWKKILKRVPNSRLILNTPPGSHRKALLQRFGDRNVELVAVRSLDWLGYMSLHQSIDIALDPFPYNGGITSCDALWMGVPVVTLSGAMPMGRAGRSILNNVGLPELVAPSPEDYLRIAVELAADRPRLAEYRATLREQMRASPLMDAPTFARDFEAALRAMWHGWCGQK